VVSTRIFALRELTACAFLVVVFGITDHDTMSTETSTTPSAGWKVVYAWAGCETSIEPSNEPSEDRLAAATREDRPQRYRAKHLRGVSS